jgi:predicted CxxxxCH...CXXCH cytochrome family protein
MMPSDIIKESTMERHHNAGHKNARVIFWLISLMVLIASPSMVQAAITCGACHGGGDGSSNVKDSPTGTRNPVDGVFKGSHGTHMANNPSATQCAVCHGAAASTYTSTHSALNQNQIQMASKIDNYSGLKRARYGKGLFWNMTSMPQLSTASSTCSNVNCHFERQTDNWGSTAYTDSTACGKCHNELPTTAAHTTHISLYGNALTACTQCHADYTAAAGKMKFQHATSAGRPISVKGSYTGSNNIYLPGPASITAPVYGTCATTYCHSDGTGQFVAISWDKTVNPSTGCDFCHPKANLSGAHAKHAGRINLTSKTRTYGNYTANISAGQEGAGGSYGFGCATCHPTAAASHLNNNVDVTFVADANAGSMRAKNAGAVLNGDKSCDSVYCHSNGFATVPYVAGANGYAPIWTTVFTGDRCAKCHGNTPTTGAHGAHKVGIHYDNIFSGTSGFLGYSSSGNKAHGVSTQATTISCNLCHSNTVTTAFNKLGTACTSCHSSDAGTLALDSANAYAFHVNGNVDVAFPATNMRSKAQIRDTSFSVYSGLWSRNGGVTNYKKDATSYDVSKQLLNTAVFTAGAAGQGSCANVVCHNQRSGQPAVIWNQTLQCVDCHSQL